ncbi:MAG: Bax inhibitor-1/YccA family protein [Candidatus Omnitrophica bacterium]|nr:Bax inhibitor-1/YccA family protein [Candidatus Omnitrophota bacterium]
MESSNPTLNSGIFAKAKASVGSGETMTIQGTVNKTFILFAVLLLTASWSWSNTLNPAQAPALGITFFVSLIGGFILAIATAFKPNWAPVTAPIYAACQGVLLGALSIFFERSYPGIVVQAIGLTFAAMFTMLVAYRSGWIQATAGFRRGLMVAMISLMVFYGIVWIASFFGVHMPGFINGGGILGIGFSLFVVGIATLNFILDFDFIERASGEGLQRYMEWYGAFALMVTLIWLYMEILRLLSKLNRRN